MLWPEAMLGDSEICGVIRFSISRSIILKAVHSSVMGLYELTSVASSVGLRMVIMMRCFHASAILQCIIKCNYEFQY